jgi:predicted AlkP superfamily phosphohydrolase/phosphomutase
MRRRLVIEVLIGVALIAGFFYWLYLRPKPGPAALKPDDPIIKKSIRENRDKVLLIGVDGMTWDIALPLINEGKMSNLARLFAYGTHGIGFSSPPLISPAIWTTIATGVPREVHGIVNFFTKLPFEYREVIMTSRFRRAPALWQMASWAGRSVGVVNWYATFPAEPVRGVFVAEGAEPGKADARNVYPPEWAERLKNAPAPEYVPYQDELQNIRDSRVTRAYDLDREVFAMAFEIMRSEHPDLMMVYFQNVDVVSHGFWKYRWPLGLDHHFSVTREERERYQNVIESHYEFTDHLIGGLLAEAEGYTVIVVSDHGHGPTFPPKNIFPDLNKLLERMGYLRYQGVTCDQVLYDLWQKGRLKTPAYPASDIFMVCQELEAETGKWMAQGADMMEPAAVDAYLGARLNLVAAKGEDQEKEREQAMTVLARALKPESQRQDILWRATRAWNVRDFHMDVRGLYLNLAEREPEGIVPREDYRNFRRELVRALKDLRTESGRRLFASVEENPDKDVMPMTAADPPDVLVEIDRNAMLEDFAFRGPSDQDPIPLAAIRWSYRDVSADHVLDGVFLVSGEKARTFKNMDAGSLDLAPTVLWLLGLPVGADMPGRVLYEAFEDSLQNRPTLLIPSWSAVLKTEAPSGSEEMSPEKMKQFRDIGYIQ